MNEIGTLVKQVRVSRGLTQQQLAQLADVGLNFVYQLEKNKATVQLDKTAQVLRALGYEISATRKFDPWNELRQGASSKP
jgi:y4mF family transcriptional regulator